MADLFTLPELAAYMQQPEVSADTGGLLLELVTGLITDVYGADLPAIVPSKLKRIALESAKRAYLNPNGYVSETLGDYSYSRGNGGGGRAGVYLTAWERQEIAALGGVSTVRTVRLVSPYPDETAPWAGWQ